MKQALTGDVDAGLNVGEEKTDERSYGPHDDAQHDGVESDRSVRRGVHQTGKHGWCQVENNPNIGIRQNFMTGFNRKTTSQLCVIGNPNRCFGIHLVKTRLQAFSNRFSTGKSGENVADAIIAARAK